MIWNRFLKDADGSIAVMSGLFLSTVLAASGFAVEYARGQELRVQMQDAADSAVISATKHFMRTEDMAGARRMAREMFDASLRENDTVEIEKFEYTRDGNGKLTLEVEAVMETIIGSVPILDIGVRASAATSDEFLDIYLLLDKSFSMLLAETGPDMDDMMALSKPMIATDPVSQFGEPEGCAFACHNTEGWEADGKTLYEHAIENGITLRTHRVADAVKTVVDSTFRSGAGTTRLGIVEFGIENRLALAPTRDMTAINQVLDTHDGTLRGNTHYPEMIDFVLSQLGAPGEGASQEDARSVLVLITDGAFSGYYGGNISYNVLDPAQCARLKDAGFDLAVLNTRYDYLPDSKRYDDLVAPKADSYEPALEACASEGKYFEVEAGAEIISELRNLTSSLGPGPIIRLVE